MKKPRLVLIVGAPGAGKTTLARHLGAALGFAVLTKDGLKEGLADELGSGDLVRSRELGQMAYAALFARASELLATNQSVVVEANFHRERGETALRELATRGDAAVIECVCDADVRRARFTARAARGERHPVHLDAEILASEWSDDVSGFAI